MDLITIKFNNIKQYASNISFENIKKTGLMIILTAIILLFILFIIDQLTNYNSEKIRKKITIRTGSNSIGGGEEAFLRYWVWQRKKRKVITEILCSQYPNSNAIYPKQKWRKIGKVNLFLRRERWIIL